jgi:hypothetical protein
MEHGLAYDSMQQYGEYLRTYERGLALGWPLHAFPEFNLGDPEDQRTFALAHAYGMVWRSGVGRYGYRTGGPNPNDPDEGLLTEDGLFEAIWQFVHKPGLLSKARADIAQYEATRGRSELLSTLQSFLQSRDPLPPKDRVYSGLLNRLVSQYIDERVQYLSEQLTVVVAGRTPAAVAVGEPAQVTLERAQASTVDARSIAAQQLEQMLAMGVSREVAEAAAKEVFVKHFLEMGLSQEMSTAAAESALQKLLET